MASEINQILPIALGQLVTPQQNGVQPARLGSALQTPREISQITQVAAAQTVAKVIGGTKEQSVQVPKRSEPSFRSQEEDSETDEADKALTEKKSLGKDRSVNVVA